MRSIIVNGSFLKRQVTGVARYAREVTKRLLQHENVLVACDDLSVCTELDPQRVLHVPRSWAGRALGSKAWSQLDLPRRVGSHVLWSAENIGPLGVRNHVLTIYDIAALEHPEWFRCDFVATYRFYLPRLIKQVKAVTTISEYSRARIVEWFRLSEEQVSVAPCAVDARFQPCPTHEIAAVRGRYNLPERYILSVSSLEPRKNLRNLLEAWRRLAEQDRDGVGLVIAGERGKVFANDDYRMLLERLPSVTFTGYFPDGDLPALYSGALGLVYPSLYEGFGLPPLEAMACGTPVITCNNTSLPEVVGEDALFVEPLEPDSIAGALALLIKDEPLRLKLAQRGRQRAGLFDWDRSAQLIYRKLDAV
ncbi:MAG: glycosyltransferase family 4 protein [Gemmatimonadaceae bacterium]|nr:glycosyltransferase family 4 protein [Gloeobacterales cyanobacterium ES-bin-141]